MSPNPTQMAWLRAELDESLDAMGYAGLYEALWTINGASLDLTTGQARGLARAAVAEMLADEAAGLQLRRLDWPGGQPVSEPLPAAILDDDSSWVAGESYVALVRPARAGG